MDDKRSEVLKMLMRPEEKEALRQAAKGELCSMSDYVRRALKLKAIDGKPHVREFLESEHVDILSWIIGYIVDEGYGEKQLIPIMHIVGLFNDCPEAEKEILEFAASLHKRYAES